MRRWRVHKTTGTSRVVVVEADHYRIEAGCLLFRRESAGGTLPVVMAYSPWAWKSFSEEIDDDQS